MTKYAPDEVERYLSEQSPKYEAALRRVVNLITAELGIEPIISYQIIGWKIHKSYAIYVSGWKDHMSIHGGHHLEPLADQFPQWFKRKGATLWFQDQPELPLEVIQAVLAARFESIPPELR